MRFKILNNRDLRALIAIVIILMLSAVYFFAFADTIILKTGQKIEAPVTERADEYIKIDLDGLALTYYMDEVEKINDEEPVKPELPVITSLAQDDSVSKLKSGHLEQAAKFEKEFMFNEAIAEYETALSYEPSDTKIIFNIAKIKLELQYFNEAVEAFQRITDINPEDGAAYYNMAVAYYGLGDFDNAVDCYNNALALNYPVEEEFSLKLQPYQYQVFEINYTPVVFDSDAPVAIKVKGDVSQDMGLIKEALPSVEQLASLYRKEIFSQIKIKRFLEDYYEDSSYGEENTIFEEESAFAEEAPGFTAGENINTAEQNNFSGAEAAINENQEQIMQPQQPVDTIMQDWNVKWDDNFSKDFQVKFVISGPGKTDILVTDGKFF